MNKTTGRVYISRDVVFDERVFPFASLDAIHQTTFHQDNILLPYYVLTSPSQSSVPLALNDHVDNSNKSITASSNPIGTNTSDTSSLPPSLESKP